jgi:hypothetical protein
MFISRVRELSTEYEDRCVEPTKYPAEHSLKGGGMGSLEDELVRGGPGGRQ